MVLKMAGARPLLAATDLGDTHCLRRGSYGSICGSALEIFRNYRRAVHHYKKRLPLVGSRGWSVARGLPAPHSRREGLVRLSVCSRRPRSVGLDPIPPRRR